METQSRKKSLLTNVFFVCCAMCLFMFLGSIIGSIFTGIIVGVTGMSAEHTWILSAYLPFIGIAGLVLLFTYLTNKEIFRLYFRGAKGNNLKMLGLGAITGFVMNGLCILVAALHGDVHFELGNISVQWLLIAAVVVFIQSSTEELLVRGYLFLHIRSRYSVILAMVISSLGFALLHIFNEGITVLAFVNIAAIGLLYAFSVHYLDSIWFAMANHAMWNFTQNFLFGLPNSGLVSSESVLKLEAATDSIFYDVSFGVESTITATVVVLIGSALIFLYARKKNSAPAEITQA